MMIGGEMEAADEYGLQDEETLKTLLETCFDLDERLKIRRALRKIRADQVAAAKTAAAVPKSKSSIQKALSLRDDRLTRRCSLTRRRISKGDLEDTKKPGHTDDRSEDSDDQQPVTDQNDVQDGPLSRLHGAPPGQQISGESNKTAPKQNQNSEGVEKLKNGLSDSVRPWKINFPGRTSSLKEDRPLAFRRVSEPCTSVQLSPSRDLLNGNSSSDKKVNGFNKPRRSITFGDPNVHSLLIKRSTDPDKEERNLDEIDNLLELNSLLRESRDFEERRRIRARIRQIKDDMHEEKAKASAAQSTPSTSDISHMTDDEINNALSAVKQQINKELTKPVKSSSQESKVESTPIPNNKIVRRTPLVLVQQPTQESDLTDTRIGKEPVQFTDEPPTRVRKQAYTEHSVSKPVQPLRKSSGSGPIMNQESEKYSDDVHSVDEREKPFRKSSVRSLLQGSTKYQDQDTDPDKIDQESEKQQLRNENQRKSSGSGTILDNKPDENSGTAVDRKKSRVELEQAFDDVLDDLQYEAEALKKDKAARLSVSSITSNDLPSLSASQNEGRLNSQGPGAVAEDSVVMEIVTLETVARETGSTKNVDQESVSTQQTLTDRMSEVETAGFEGDGHELKLGDDKSAEANRSHRKHSEKEDSEKKEKKHKHKHRQHHKDGEVDREERKERKKRHKHQKHHGDEEHKEKKKGSRELPPDSDLAGIDDNAVLEKMLEETTDFDRRREIRHAIRVLKRRTRDAAREQKEKKEKESSKLEELEVRKQDDGSVVVEATEKGPKEEKVTTVLTKKSRTESKSLLVTKDTTVVTKRKTSKGEEYTEVDNIVTSKKLTTRGSLYMKTDLVRAKHLKDSKGHEFIKEEVISRQAEDSISKDEAKEDLVTTTTHLVLDEPIMESKVSVEEEVPKVAFFLPSEPPEVESVSEDKVSEVTPDKTVQPQVVMVEETKNERTDTNKVSPEYEDYVYELIDPLFNQETKVGTPAALECKINSNCPSVKILWYREDTQLENGDDYFQTFNGTTAKLLIQDPQLNDAGMYRCVVKSGEMTELECGARLTVIEEAPPAKEPVIVEHLKDKTANDGDKVVMDCSVEPAQNLTIRWYKDDVIVKNDADFKQTLKGNKAKLVISEIFPEDAGVYSCVVSNEYGEARSACTLHISQEEETEPATIIAPDFIEELKDITCKDGDKVSYSCKVVGDPKPIITWYKNDRLIRNSADFFQTYDGFTAKLVIEDVYPDDMGVFKCLAENKAGQAESKAHLIVLGPHKDDEKPSTDIIVASNASKGKDLLESKQTGVVEDLPLKGTVTGTSEKGKIDVTPEKISTDTKAVPEDTTNDIVFGKVNSEKIPEKAAVETVRIDSEGSEIVEPVEVSAPAVGNETFPDKDSVPKRLETKELSAVTPQKAAVNSKPAEEPKPAIMRSQSEIVTPKTNLDVSNSRSPYTMNRPVLKSSIQPFKPQVDTESTVPKSNSTEPESIKKGISSQSELPKQKMNDVDMQKKDSLVSDQSLKVASPQRSVSLRLQQRPENEKPSLLQKKTSLQSPADLSRRVGALSPEEQPKTAVGLKRTSSKVGDLRSKFENMNQGSPSAPKPLHPVGRSHSVIVKPTQDPSLTQGKEKKDAQNAIATFLMNRTGSMKSPGEPRPTLTTKMSAVDYESITDEVKLQKLLTDTQDFDERKKIRQRIRDVRDKQKEELEAQRKSKDADETRRRQKLAEEDKQRRLNQFQKIASDPDSVRKDDPRPNVDVVRDMAKVNEAAKQKTLQNVKEMAGQSPSSEGLGSQAERLVQLRQKEAEEAKQRKLQSYGEMAKRETHSKTETLETQDGSSKTITTTTTQEGPDGSKVITRQQKTTTTMTGAGGTVYGAKGARPQGARGAMAAFKQMDTSANPGASKAKPNFLGGAGGKGVNVQRSPSAIKQMLLGWCASMTRGYEGVNVTNFSSSWADGLAFCALIHHFHPEAFDFSELKPKHRRHNFTLAFDTAEKYADIAPLLDVDDMVRMKNPDWKCVFTYVQSYYRKFRNHECSVHRAAQPQ